MYMFVCVCSSVCWAYTYRYIPLYVQEFQARKRHIMEQELSLKELQGKNLSLAESLKRIKDENKRLKREVCERNRLYVTLKCVLLHISFFTHLNQTVQLV